MDKIFDANDLAQSTGFNDGLERIKAIGRNHGLPSWNGKVSEDNPVVARVERGRWIADCECGGAEWVAESVPFFCFSCGNASVNGDGRLVIFPTNRREVEVALLERGVVNNPQLSQINNALNAKPMVQNCGRDWHPEKTVDDLRSAHKLAKERK
jgi:hypothetical protein